MAKKGREMRTYCIHRSGTVKRKFGICFVSFLFYTPVLEAIIDTSMHSTHKNNNNSSLVTCPYWEKGPKIRGKSAQKQL